MVKPIDLWNSISLTVKVTLISAFVSLLIFKLGGDGRYEIKNMKFPIRTIIGANTTVTYQDEIVRVDTRTGKAWKLQHGTSNISGDTCEFSIWDELGNTYRPSGKKIGTGK